MRISDWSSDVCSSDLLVGGHHMVRAIAIGGGQFDHLVHHLFGIAGATAELEAALAQRGDTRQRAGDQRRVLADLGDLQRRKALINRRDRKSVDEGKSASVRVELGGRRRINKKN